MLCRCPITRGRYAASQAARGGHCCDRCAESPSPPSFEEEADVALAVFDRDKEPTTSKWEIWSWYAYSVGANGVGPYNFAPAAFQNLLEQAAAPSGILEFASSQRDANSIILLCDGISFAIQMVLFLLIGAYADFGTGRRWILLTASVISYAVGFAWLGVYQADRLEAAAALYMVGSIAYQVATTYWAAAFPSLAYNTQHLKDARAAYANRQMCLKELRRRDELERSKLNNVGLWMQSIFELFQLAAAIGIMFAVQQHRLNPPDNNNSWGFSILITFATGWWLLFSIPWFFVEKTRRGLQIPPGRTVFTVGIWQLCYVLRRMGKLRQTLLFFVCYFFLGDALNTSVTLIGTLQNQIVDFDTLQLTYLLLLNIAAQAVGVSAFWLIQKRCKVSPVVMFYAIMLAIILLNVWGMIGNWTAKFGFHNLWEVWAYQAFFGLFISPWLSYTQIILSSVTPRGYEYLFFSVFNIVGKTSSVVGPLISSTIIDSTLKSGQPNHNAPFYFLFSIAFTSALGIYVYLDLDKSATEQDTFLLCAASRTDEGFLSVIDRQTM